MPVTPDAYYFTIRHKTDDVTYEIKNLAHLKIYQKLY